MSCAIVIKMVKEKKSWSFNFLAGTTNRIYAILKISPKFMMRRMAQSKSNLVKKISPSLLLALNSWLGSGLFRWNQNPFCWYLIKKSVFSPMSYVYACDVLFLVYKTFLQGKGILKKSYVIYHICTSSTSVGSKVWV